MTYDKNILAEAKKQLAILSIKHLERVDARTLTIFHKHGVLDSIEMKFDSKDTLPILKNAGHPDRQDIGTGPLICHLTKKEPPEASIVDVRDLLLATDKQLRAESVKYLENLSDGETRLLTPKSKATLKALAGNVLSDESHTWRDAAVAIHDALKDDWCCSCAALKQSLHINKMSAIEQHLTKVIRPTVSSVDSIMGGVWEALKQKEEIQAKIEQIVNDNPDFTKALDEYLMTLGHIPLCLDLSIISLIDKWQDKYGKMEDIWKELWKWADSYKLPLPRYHVCVYFIYNPNLVPNAKYKDLWHEITEIIYITNDEATDMKWSHSWKMFCEIARHYCYHLETRLPYMNGERIASQAWWLSLQICKAFSSEKEDAEHLRTETFLPELGFSSRVWQIASPLITPSSLRYLTLNTHSIFASSLEAILFDRFDSVNPELIDQADYKKIGKALTGTLLTAYPPVLKKDKDITYMFDKSPLNAAIKWVDSIDEGDKQREMINAFIKGIKELVDSESLSSQLNKFTDSHSGDQILIANYFRNMVFTEEVALEDIWKIIENPDWQEAAFINSHPVILELIVGALDEITVRYQDKWAYNLPHFYALACEKCKDNDKKSQLFTCMIYSSLSGNTVSGIQRLLKSEKKHSYADYIKHWRNVLEDTHKWAPEWVKAKIRPVLAVLHL